MVTAIERLGRLYNGRCGFVSAGHPLCRIQCGLRLGSPDGRHQDSGKVRTVRPDRRCNTVCGPVEVHLAIKSARGHDYWDDEPMMADLMKVLQIERVVMSLLDS